jgi:protein phosphatase
MPQKVFSGMTDIGLQRGRNEDAFVISPELDFCLAADGMGGAAAGELASRIFAETQKQ